MEQPKTLGQRAKQVRDDLKMKQPEIAAFLEISLGTWQKMERDEVLPNAETLLKFEKLRINPGWMLSGIGPKSFGDWQLDDAATELMLAVVNMVEDEHVSLNMPIPERGLIRMARPIFNQMMTSLDDDASAEEIELALAGQRARLRRQLLSAVSDPGSGKRSAS